MSEDQARDKDGKFASGGHGGEQEARQAGKYPVTKHQQDAPGARTGKSVAADWRAQHQAAAAKSSGAGRKALGNLGKAALGLAAGFAGTLVGSAIRAQHRGGRR